MKWLFFLIFIFGLSLNSLWASNQLTHEIFQRIDRVEEFRVLREEARKLGIEHVYLFGGAASSWGHFVKWRLEQEARDQSQSDARFAYRFYNIFSTGQDVDIVVDADNDSIQKLQKAMQEKFNYRQGELGVWEMRPLRQSDGRHAALMGNSDILKQNTDSMSIGLINLFDQNQITDLYQINGVNQNCEFCVDLKLGRIRFFENENHTTTLRYLKGDNPFMLSAIRFINKLLQFDLTADRKEIERAVSLIDPAKVEGQYAHKYFSLQLKKVFLNAQSLERAVNLFQEFGLKEKLAAYYKNIDPQLYLLLNRVALPYNEAVERSSSGRTAKELRLQQVVHGTSGFEEFFSIVRNRHGVPNFFKSRKNAQGELAVHGDGVYVSLGNKGERGMYDVYLDILPEAIEGRDFVVINASTAILLNTHFIRIANRNFQSSDQGLEKFAKGELELTTRQMNILFSLGTRADLEIVQQLMARPNLESFYQFVASDLFLKDASLHDKVLADPHFLSLIILDTRMHKLLDISKLYLSRLPKDQFMLILKKISQTIERETGNLNAVALYDFLSASLPETNLNLRDVPGSFLKLLISSGQLRLRTTENNLLDFEKCVMGSDKNAFNNLLFKEASFRLFPESVNYSDFFLGHLLNQADLFEKVIPHLLLSNNLSLLNYLERYPLMLFKIGLAFGTDSLKGINWDKVNTIPFSESELLALNHFKVGVDQFKKNFIAKDRNSLKQFNKRLFQKLALDQSRLRVIHSSGVLHLVLNEYYLNRPDRKMLNLVYDHIIEANLIASMLQWKSYSDFYFNDFKEYLNSKMNLVEKLEFLVRNSNQSFTHLSDLFLMEYSSDQIEELMLFMEQKNSSRNESYLYWETFKKFFVGKQFDDNFSVHVCRESYLTKINVAILNSMCMKYAFQNLSPEENVRLYFNKQMGVGDIDRLCPSCLSDARIRSNVLKALLRSRHNSPSMLYSFHFLFEKYPESFTQETVDFAALNMLPEIFHPYMANLAKSTSVNHDWVKIYQNTVQSLLLDHDLEKGKRTLEFPIYVFQKMQDYEELKSLPDMIFQFHLWRFAQGKLTSEERRKLILLLPFVSKENVSMFILSLNMSHQLRPLLESVDFLHKLQIVFKLKSVGKDSLEIKELVSSINHNQHLIVKLNELKHRHQFQLPSGQESCLSILNRIIE